jgi:hypothetical protein
LIIVILPSKIENNKIFTDKVSVYFMSRKGHSITLALQEQDKVQLEHLALELRYTWGNRPNISKLVEAIARRKLLIAPNHDWQPQRIQALNRARQALVDAGEIETALHLAALLLERSELTIPLRKELERFVAKPASSWRLEVEQFIRRQHPFKLSYQDAAGQVWSFTVRYAEIVRHENRQYLDCWCEETQGNRDVPELTHNWCLRLDRITDAVVQQMSGSWKQGLAAIAVEMHLRGGLAFAYESKSTHDQINEWLTESPPTRQVVRQVTNSFWFIREVLRYGKDCLVVSPEYIQTKIKHEISELYRSYNSLPE